MGPVVIVIVFGLFAVLVIAGIIYSFQSFLGRIVTMNLPDWRVVRAPCSVTVQYFDAPKGCSFYRMVPVGDARIVW